jgi:hypothetical protein
VDDRGASPRAPKMVNGLGGNFKNEILIFAPFGDAKDATSPLHGHAGGIIGEQWDKDAIITEGCRFSSISQKKTGVIWINLIPAITGENLSA